MIIYKATNTINGKCYIGKTVYSLKKRKSDHLSEAKTKSNNYYFHNAIRKYGKDAFIWNIVDDTCETEDELNMMEYHYIMQYNSYKTGNGYNLTLGGDGTCGWSPSEEIRQNSSKRMKLYRIEHPWSGINHPNYGKNLTDETKQKLSERCFTQNHPLYNVSGKDHPNYGKRHTEESKQKIGDALRGKRLSDEIKDKMRKAQQALIRNLKYGSDNPTSKMWEITRPDGIVEIIKGLQHYCKQNGLNRNSMASVSRGEQAHHKGYRCRKLIK